MGMSKNILTGSYFFKFYFFKEYKKMPANNFFKKNETHFKAYSRPNVTIVCNLLT